MTLHDERARASTRRATSSAGPTKIIDAIAAGHRVAACVVRDLTGDAATARRARRGERGARRGARDDEVQARDAHAASRWRSSSSTRPSRRFDEIELGYTEYEAAREAQRCLGCTTGARLAREKCASCLTCMRVCPHDAPGVKVGGFLYFDAETCHACGACASQCPAQAISLEGHSDEEMMRRVERALDEPGLDTTLVFACGCTPNLPALPGTDVAHDHRHVPAARRASAPRSRRCSPGASRIALHRLRRGELPLPARARARRRSASRRSARTLHQLGMDDALDRARRVAEEEDVHLR